MNNPNTNEELENDVQNIEELETDDFELQDESVIE